MAPHEAGSPRVVVNGRFMLQSLTGVQRFARGIVRELISQRNDVVVAVPSDGEVLEDYAHIPYTTVGRRSGHAWEQLDLPAFARKHDSLLLSLGSTAPISYRKQIVTHHDITYVRHPASFPFTFRLLYRTIAPLFLRRSRAIITVSEFSRAEIASFFNIPASKFEVVYNATDDQFDTHAAPGDGGYLLAVSSPSSHKGFGTLLDAYASWDSDSKPALVVVGSTARALVRPDLDENALDGVSFVGRVSDEELINRYRDALVFVFPSLYEGFGIPPIEAQASGTPVLASDIPPLREVLGESVDYFTPGSERSLASALERICADVARREELRRLGIANAARFSWRDSAERVTRLIDKNLQ